MRLDPRADHITRRPVGIYVIRAILRIILDDEDGCALPYRALAYCFDKLSDSKVIISNLSLGREFARRCSLGVIVVEPHGHKGGHRVSARVLGQHFFELTLPLRKAARHIVLAILSPRV